jgi:mannose-1-phosphate guanylyltransferase / phosphomannomutase
MEHVLRLLRRHGFDECVVTVQFLASVIRNYFGDGADLGLRLFYATEDEPLGTAGSVKNAEHFLDETFLVISGDAVTDIDLGQALEFHRKREAALTVVLKRVEDPLEFGIVITDEDGRIDRIMEKPGWGEVFSDTINTGIYVIEPEVLGHVPVGQEFDFAHELFPALLGKGLPLYGFVGEGFWTDVGNLEAYLQVHRDILDRNVEVELGGHEMGGGVWLADGAEVDPGASLTGPLYVGENSRIEAGATLREYAVLGKGVVVKNGASVQRAIVHDHAYVGTSVSLRGCVVGKNTDVKHGARLEEDVVVSDECIVGEGAVLSPGVKVFPFKTIDPGALVTKSIVWETRAARGLFGERGVSGLMNIDVTPEMALRLALAFAGTTAKRSVVAASRDATRTARVIKRAMVAGINAAALDAHDLELVPVPVTRYYVRNTRAAGGLVVRSSPGDPQSVDIQFLDERGLDIAPGIQRKVERAFFRDDLRRAFPHEVGELTFPARGWEYYLRGIVDAVDPGVVRGSAPKLAVDYAWGTASITAPMVLGRLGADLLAVNATVDEQRSVLTREALDEHLEALAAVVRSSGAELGALVDATGERLWLVDERGRIVGLSQALLAYIRLVTEVANAPRIAVPVASSRVVEDMVRGRGGEVVWTAISQAALSAASDGGDVVFAGAEGGGYVFPSFLPAYDAVMSLAKLLELLVRTDQRLGDIVDGLPESHVVRVDVPTPWEAKGTVMRRLVERYAEEDIVTIDGVKTYRGRDWALVVPHPLEPVVRVWAEADDHEAAQRLAGEFAALVEEVRG